MKNKTAPTGYDVEFHGNRTQYAQKSFKKNFDKGIIGPEDEDIIKEFVNDVRAYKNISVVRQNKLTSHLINWRRYIGPFKENTIRDLVAGINLLKDARSERTGQKFKKNTYRDYISILKQFYFWLTEKGYTEITEREIKKIKSLPKDRSTKKPTSFFSPKEISDFIDACLTVKDKAMFLMMYEAGLRPGEIASLTWDKVTIDKSGVVLNIEFKTNKPRYIRIVMVKSYLSQWKDLYPYVPSGNNLVFLNRLNKPYIHNTMSMQFRKILARADISKHVTLYAFRHSRITHLVREGLNESVIKLMMWGDVNAEEFKTYVHLTGQDIDNIYISHYGIEVPAELKEPGLVPVECLQCHFIASSTSKYCPECGYPLDPDLLNDYLAKKDVIAQDGDILEAKVQEMVKKILKKEVH